MKQRWIILIVILSLFAISTKDSFAGIKKTPGAITIPVNLSTRTNCSFCPFRSESEIGGFSIDGHFLRTDDNFLVRILLIDKQGKEHLVMELYKEICDTISFDFADYCEETVILDNVQPLSVRLYVIGAEIQLSSINVAKKLSERQSQKEAIDDATESIKRKHVRNVVNKINTYNETHKKLWRAGITPLSLKSYEEKKRIMGFDDNVSTGAIEYYDGGILEIGEPDSTDHLRVSNNTYVNEFDWRKRHGKNWMTSIKNQGNSNCCFLFACVGAVEAMTNLYYNQKLDLDLSEQELTSCSSLSDPYTYGTPDDMMDRPLNYLVNHGVCDEQSYPFVYYQNQPCLSGYITPYEQIRISGYEVVDYTDENEIKEAIINHGPLISGIRSYVWMHHAMVLVGYGVLQAGDTIYHHLGYNHDTGTYFHDKYLTVEANDPRIGRTYMIYKNSYGITDSDSNQGYMYVIHNNYSTSMNQTFYLTTPFSSLNYSEEDVVLEDADGDGFYFWGLGPKPSNSPSWIPDQPDGDDSNYQYGPMNTYGHLQDLELWGLQTLHTLIDLTYSSRMFLYSNLCVCSMSKLTITSIITLYGNTKIIVEPNGELIIDGGTLQNADIVLRTGSKLTLKNGGSIIMRNGKDFNAPIGATVTIDEGQIRQ